MNFSPQTISMQRKELSRGLGSSQKNAAITRRKPNPFLKPEAVSQPESPNIAKPEYERRNSVKLQSQPWPQRSPPLSAREVARRPTLLSRSTMPPPPTCKSIT